MEMETKQLYVFIVLITLALKINASPLTENGTEDELNPPSLNTSLGGGLGSHCENTLNEMPNIESAFKGRFLFLFVFGLFRGDPRIFLYIT